MPKKLRLGKATWIALVGILALFASSAHAQNVSPFGGIGNVQLLDGNGNICPNCVLYSFQAGTTTQQPTYTDATGLTLNPNPIPFNGSGRAAIWLSNLITYKFVLCLQNDGPACTPGDTQFVVDQVPGSPSSQQQGNAFTGTFSSGSANTASSGILRLASGDSICWRNAANSGNLCLSKDATDILSWAGAFKCTEGGAPSGQVGFDIWWCDAATHRMKHVDNNTLSVQFVNSGVDINTSDQVTQVHFGATAIPMGAIAPTANQYFQFVGGVVVGTSIPTPANCAPTLGGYAVTFTGGAWSCTEIIPPVVKKGSNGGNYTTSSTTFVDVDTTNLKDVVTIPTGSNLVIQAEGVFGASAGPSSYTAAISDGGTPVTQTFFQISSGGTPNDTPFSIIAVIPGDGASHTITLQYKMAGGSSANPVIPNTGGLFPVMLFTLQ